MKNLDKFFNRKDIPRVSLVWEKHYSNGKLPNSIRKGSFWWRDILKLTFSTIQVQDGITCFFWTDNWILLDLFNLPLSTEAYTHLNTVQSFLEHFPLTDQEDKWLSDWGQYSPSKTYGFLIGNRHAHQVYEWLWKCFCQPKRKVFFWLLLKDGLSTGNILRRKRMHLDSYNYILYQLSTEETCQHLFIDCTFAKDCWHLLGITFQSGTNITNCVSNSKMSHTQFSS